MKKSSWVTVLAILVGVGAASAMNINKLKVKTQCKDARLYMDGGLYANVMQGGLTPRTVIQLMQLQNNHLVPRANIEVMQKNYLKGKEVQEFYSGKNFRLSIMRAQPPAANWTGQVDTELDHKKVTAPLICKAKSI